MNIRVKVVIVAAIGILNTATSAMAAPVLLDDWSLTTRVTVEGMGNDSEFSGTPMTPWQATHNGMLGNSTAQSIYNVSANADGLLDFMVEGIYETQGNPDITFSRSTGFIFLTPQVDSM